MASCRHHSGYLADDEAGHSTYIARVQPPKKPLLPEMGSASKLGRMPHPPSMDGNSAYRGHRQTAKGPQAFGSFLDFLTEGQVLDSLQTVVEEATERMAAMKTEAGVPLVEIQDPIEVPSGRRPRVRPSFSTVHRHRAQPSLCTGRPNNYPSCSSSMSDSHSSLTAGCLGSHSWNSDVGAQGLGSVPPTRDRLLLEKNLKRLLRLEKKGKGLNQPSSKRESLLWDSLGSQASSQRTREQPLSWFSGLLGSRPGTPEASEMGPGERELFFLKREFNKEMKSLLSQPASFDLPGYCSVRQPHCTLDFLAKHHLFPALQTVVSQAVDKLSCARRPDGCPLFPVNCDPNPALSFNLLPQDSRMVTPTRRREHYDSFLSRASSSKITPRKTKGKRCSPPVSNAQVATKLRLKSPSVKFTKKKSLPSISSKSSMSHLSNPWYEELINFLVEQAVSLLICKYKFENNLNKQLGFISFPITETLMDLFLGFKKVKGSHIRLSSKIDWRCLLHKLEEDHLLHQVSRQASRLGAHHPSSISQVGASQVSASHVSTSHHRVPHFGPSWRSTVPLTPQSTMHPEPVTDRTKAQAQAHSQARAQAQAQTQAYSQTQAQDHSQAQAQAQAIEPDPSLNIELPILQLHSTQEPTTEEGKIPTSLSEPKLSVSSTTSMGFSPPESKEMVNVEDIDGSDKDKDKDSDEDKNEVKGTDSDKDKDKDKDSDEDKYEDEGSDEDEYGDEDEDEYENEGSDEEKEEDEGSDEDEDEVEDENEDEVEDEDEGSDKDKEEGEQYSVYDSESQSFPEPGLETIINYSVDMGHSDPP
nr:coiled-coil domain-containing protein 116 isoform X1 [Marmota flaviventris]